MFSKFFNRPQFSSSTLPNPKFSKFFNRRKLSSSTLPNPKKKCLERALDHEALFRALTMAFVAMTFFPESAVAGRDKDLGMTSDLVFEKLSPIILGVGCVVGCGYSIVKSSIIGVVGSLGTTAIAGYTLNSIQSGTFLKMLGGE